ncbi:MAG: hypothetical protein ACHQ17_15745 [Polyangia bacterium]
MRAPNLHCNACAEGDQGDDMLAVVANDWGAGLSWVIWVLVMLAVVALVVFGTRGRTPRRK